jgi:hypothetical protein
VGLSAHTCAITVPKTAFVEAKAWLQERVSLLERDGLDEVALRRRGTPGPSTSPGRMGFCSN